MTHTLAEAIKMAGTGKPETWKEAALIIKRFNTCDPAGCTLSQLNAATLAGKLAYNTLVRENRRGNAPSDCKWGPLVPPPFAKVFRIGSGPADVGTLHFNTWEGIWER